MDANNTTPALRAKSCVVNLLQIGCTMYVYIEPMGHCFYTLV